MDNEMNSDEIIEIIDVTLEAIMPQAKIYKWNRIAEAFTVILTCAACENEVPKKVLKEQFCKAVDQYWEKLEKQDSKEAQDKRR